MAGLTEAQKKKLAEEVSVEIGKFVRTNVFMKFFVYKTRSWDSISMNQGIPTSKYDAAPGALSEAPQGFPSDKKLRGEFVNYTSTEPNTDWPFEIILENGLLRPPSNFLPKMLAKQLELSFQESKYSVTPPAGVDPNTAGVWTADREFVFGANIATQLVFGLASIGTARVIFYPELKYSPNAEQIRGGGPPC